MKRIFIVFIILLSTSIQAELVVNEVMYNEPDGYTSLEWIELYNNSDTLVNLDAYEFDINGSLLSLPLQSLSGREYALLVRKLYKGTGSTSFETYWGNDSDVWGDNSFEQTISEPIELTFSLPNSSGSIELLMNSTTISSFSWDDEGLDGVSFERKFADSSYFEQSVSREFSTPGRVNSVTSLPFDISLDYVRPYYIGKQPMMIISVTNRSLSGEDYFHVTFVDSLDYYRYIYVGSNRNDFEGTVVETTFVDAFLWDYRGLTAYLDINHPDNRPENDTVHFTSIGVLYPPLVISEFYANPPSTFEWVEIYNRSYSIIDLSDWYFGDRLKLNRMSDTSVICYPGQYAVLVYDKEIFRIFNTDVPQDILLIEPPSWSTLNNELDTIRLVDQYDVQADMLGYHIRMFEDYPFGRTVLNPYNPSYTRSLNQVGTPGEKNELFYATDGNVSLNLYSKFFEYGDDPLRLFLRYPIADSYSIKVYNKNGQKVAVIADEVSVLESDIEWYGETITGKRLPIGMYVIVVEVEGAVMAKETFVVAR